MHANIHVVKMILETAQLLCNVHHRQREHCLPPYIGRNRIPYKESRAGHRQLGSMIWVSESLGNYRWAVQLGLALCAEYNRGRSRASGKTTLHKTQKVLEWLQRNEPNFETKRRTLVRLKHLAMPDKFKKAATSVEAYRDYYYSKRKTMAMAWEPHRRAPEWWEARRPGKTRVATKGSAKGGGTGMKKRHATAGNDAIAGQEQAQARPVLAASPPNVADEVPDNGGGDKAINPSPAKRLRGKTAIEDVTDTTSTDPRVQ